MFNVSIKNKIRQINYWLFRGLPQPYALEVSNQVQLEKTEGNDKQSESPPSYSNPAAANNNKDKHTTIIVPLWLGKTWRGE